MSQLVTELCIALVHDAYGELASRVFGVLSDYGRLSASRVAFYSNLQPNQVKYCLALLIQQNLAFWNCAPDSGTTYYETSLANAYALLRFGKQLELVKVKCGDVAAALLSEVHLAGQCSIQDLKDAFIASQNHLSKLPDGVINGYVSDQTLNVESDILGQMDAFVSSLQTLIRAQYLSISHKSHLRPPHDNRKEAENIAKRELQINGPVKEKERSEFESTTKELLEEWKFGTHEDRQAVLNKVEAGFKSMNSLKRSLQDDSAADGEAKKRRQLNNGSVEVNGYTEATNAGFTSYLRHETVRVNYQKLALLVKLQALGSKTRGLIFETTSQVFSKVLQVLEVELTEWPIQNVEHVEQNGLVENLPQISTKDILTQTGPAISFQDSIAPISVWTQSNRGSLHRAQATIYDENDDIRPLASDVISKNQGFNGSVRENADYPLDMGSQNELNSEFNEKLSHDAGRSQVGPLRQHLLLLAEHPIKFLIKIDRGSFSSESWGVPVARLLLKARTLAIMETIETRFGRPAVRLAGVLEERGKLDEKALASHSLLNQKVMRASLAAMHSAGLLELQEVPRDNNRQPARTMFLWFFDPHRCALKLLEESYKAMVRLIQRLRIERESVKAIIAKAGRSDVVGREEEFLTQTELSGLKKWKAKESKTFGELYKLDDFVSLLRED